MLINLPRPYRKRPPKAKRTKAPAALTLVAAEYSEAVYVRLTFDRAIRIVQMSTNQITVRDGLLSGNLFQGGEDAVLINPTTVEVSLVAIEEFTDEYIALYATASTGIKAVDDGGTWAGGWQIPLPYP